MKARAGPEVPGGVGSMGATNAQAGTAAWSPERDPKLSPPSMGTTPTLSRVRDTLQTAHV